MIHQNLNTETIVLLAIYLFVGLLFVGMLIAAVASILAEHSAKIASRPKTEFKSNSVVTRFTKFLPKRKA